MTASATLHEIGDRDTRVVAVWRFPAESVVLSSAAVGGGLVRTDALINIGVVGDYTRVDLESHASAIRDRLLLPPCPALFTAADVNRMASCEDHEVRCDATVGITRPTWAADRDGEMANWHPGTINLVVQIPVTLAEAALVNAVITATEAKTQALLRAAIPGTGTASDAVAIVVPAFGEPVPFAGPRSEWGSRIARAVHAAVAEGIERHP